ncbi:MAG: EAL domain-containing protein [Hyphomicrobium sp.]|nr:MAG: EAL domain-containing protein [Hyphomicrobium sp.]
MRMRQKQSRTAEFSAALRSTGTPKQQLERLNRWLEVALNNMVRGLSMFDAQQRLILCNDLYRKIYNLPERLTRPGTPLAEIVRYHAKHESAGGSPKDIEKQRKWIAQHVAALQRGKSFTHTQHLQGGRTILVTNQPLSDGSWVDLQEDITERCLAEQKISWLAHHDTLTELPNRFHFHERLEAALGSLAQDDGLAIHWFDLDRFKAVNDDLGHLFGDALLRSIGARLRRVVREPDFVGRLGGDEFAIIQTHVTQRRQAIHFAERILRILNKPHQVMGHKIDVGASLGIAMALDRGANAEDLLNMADVALYEAKSRARGRYAFFETDRGYEQRTRRRLESDLKAALAQEQLELHYQPIIDADTGNVTSCEALLRWKHPQLGAIAPGDFIPLAEETGLILAIGDWALRQACRDAASWPDSIGVTVNVSAMQFIGSNFYDGVSTALRLSSLAPQRLELEITESVLLRDDAQTLATLHKLRERGVRIALDDFGTAFASLSYLRSFPFDTIKIDRSFARELPRRVDCAAIIQSVSSLARSLNMRSVIEGVETSEQLAMLKDKGCDQLQGYYFSKPVLAREVEELLVRVHGANDGRGMP